MPFPAHIAKCKNTDLGTIKIKNISFPSVMFKPAMNNYSWKKIKVITLIIAKRKTFLISDTFMAPALLSCRSNLV